MIGRFRRGAGVGHNAHPWVCLRDRCYDKGDEQRKGRRRVDSIEPPVLQTFYLHLRRLDDGER